MGEHELIFNAKEMRIVEVICPICGGGVIFDAADDGQKAPVSLSSCASDDEEMYSWLNGYRKWYQAITHSQKQFRFRVQINERKTETGRTEKNSN